MKDKHTLRLIIVCTTFVIAIALFSIALSIVGFSMMPQPEVHCNLQDIDYYPVRHMNETGIIPIQPRSIDCSSKGWLLPLAIVEMIK